MWERWEELSRLAGEVSLWFFSSRYAIIAAIILDILVVIFYFLASTGILNRYFHNLFLKDAFKEKRWEMRGWSLSLLGCVCGIAIIWYQMLSNPEFDPKRFQGFSFEEREAALFSIRLLSIAAAFSIFFFIFCIGINVRDVRQLPSTDEHDESGGGAEQEEDSTSSIPAQPEPTNGQKTSQENA